MIFYLWLVKVNGGSKNYVTTVCEIESVCKIHGDGERMDTRRRECERNAG